MKAAREDNLARLDCLFGGPLDCRFGALDCPPEAPGGQSGPEAGLETILRYRISGPGRTIWATNWRTNWARRPGLETILRYRIPGPREDNLGDKLADKLRLGGPDWRQFCVTGFRAIGCRGRPYVSGLC